MVIDVQRSQLGRDLAPYPVTRVVSNASRLVSAARAANWLVVYVRSSHLPGGGDEVRTRTDARAHSASRPHGWDQLVPELSPLPHEPVTIKRGWDAFYGSDLELQLRRHGVDNVVLCGISTNFGVEGTARAAYDRNFELVFAVDAMSAADERSHEHTLRTVFPRIGRVLSTEAIIAESRQ